MTPDRAGTEAETRAQERAREAAERAEFDRLSQIYFAHWNAIAPGQFHCFCGSLDDLRRAVADLDRRAARDPVRDPARRPSTGRAAHRSSADARDASADGDHDRREQLARWHAQDRAGEESVGEDSTHAAADAGAE
ncbi:hypothetical protein Acsp06_54160 [Actinomycetospora sp. NBRC 106375]|uniref:hypothetical protein n=1 Tax=Actinomycetospora sp. NBRC 106375 TaxID=3032207 RepID=UPI0024A30416|nr:hypothetical protein [Actinomycetospora sp. NBRC 106375]GLZ49231.1 hypothetical protein Acsp06_54160 [Actinomycetospora sp. NBRC 106375]